jgi:5'-phosphate synthase pdxT subunit
MTSCIGILALQGAVAPHYPHLAALGAEFSAVRHARQLENLDGLILPGGESSAMLKLIEYNDLKNPLAEFLSAKPSWGVCAGAILLAREVTAPTQFSFGTLNIRVRRNGYGSQLDSFHADVAGYPVAFIRAPVIEDIGADITVRGSHAGHPVWVEQGHTMATSFHPELTPDAPSPMHQRFLELVKGK